jgi:hypothetical protein
MLKLQSFVVITPWRWHLDAEMCRSRPWTWSVFYDLCICILLSVFCWLTYWIHHAVSEAQNVCIWISLRYAFRSTDVNTFSKYELMAQDSTTGLPTRTGILHYKPGHSSRRNRQHVHRLVFYVARTSHNTTHFLPSRYVIIFLLQRSEMVP